MKTFENLRKVGSDYFGLSYSRRSNLSLQHYLNQFNLDDYIIFKKTNKFKIITKDELMEEKYSGYLFIRKGIYDEVNTKLWFNWIKDNIKFLAKPFPNFNPYEKIIEMN